MAESSISFNTMVVILSFSADRTRNWGRGRGSLRSVNELSDVSDRRKGLACGITRIVPETVNVNTPFCGVANSFIFKWIDIGTLGGRTTSVGSVSASGRALTDDALLFRRSGLDATVASDAIEDKGVVAGESSNAESSMLWDGRGARRREDDEVDT
jgi:hypothetical protein